MAYFKRIGTRLSALFSGGVLLREQKLFMTMISLFFAAAGLSGIFINTFIYSCAYTSGEFVSGIKSVAYYNLCLYASMAVFSVIIGIVGKGISSRILMAAGLLFYAFVFVLLLLLGSGCVSYIWVIGFLSGAGTALFQFTYSEAVTFATSGENRDHYLAVQGAINSVTAMISPLAAGTLLELVGGFNGYTVLFAVTLVVLGISMVCCLALSYSDGTKPNTHFGNVFVYSVKDKSLRYASLGELVSGLRDGVMGFLVPILLFVLNFSNFAVGVYMFIYAGIQLLSSRWANSKVGSRSKNFAIFLSALLYAGLGFIFFAGTEIIPVFSYGVCSSAVQSFFAAAAFFVFYDAAYKIPNSHYKNLEILTLREFYRNTGRVIGIFAVLFVPQETRYLVYVIAAVGVSQLFAWVLFQCSGLQMRKKERRLRAAAR